MIANDVNRGCVQMFADAQRKPIAKQPNWGQHDDVQVLSPVIGDSEEPNGCRQVTMTVRAINDRDESVRCT